MTTYIFLGVCALGGALPFITRNVRMLFGVTYAWSTVVFALGAYLGLEGIFHASLIGGGMWYIDAAAGVLLMLVSFMQWTAVLTSVPHLDEELHEGIISLRNAQQYTALLALFVLAMSATILANNLGVLWIAVEATTLATTLLVAFYAKQGSLEAAWKYLILCSTGIALSLIGLLFTYYAVQLADVKEALTLNWTDLVSTGALLSPDLMKLAFIFMLIGYGTKAGFVPMHQWLPDAHSAAPAPISGLLSGILLPVALFAVLRFKMVVDLSLGDGVWTGWLLIIFGTLSVLVSAAFVLVQQDYKRLLAYSSIEHMGLIAISFGLGGVAAVAGIIHLVAHALTKSALFFSAASIVHRFKSTKFSHVGAVLSALPYTGTLFLIGLLALLAVPPSPLFLSEYLLVARGLAVHPFVVVLVLFGLTIVAAGFIRQCMPFMYKTPDHERGSIAHGEKWTVAHAGIALHYLFVISIGIALWTPQGFAVAQHIARALSS